MFRMIPIGFPVLGGKGFFVGGIEVSLHPLTADSWGGPDISHVFGAPPPKRYKMHLLKTRFFSV